VPADVSPMSLIGGLPPPELMLVLCSACVKPVMTELATLPSLAALEQRMAAIRAARP
jgi:hypothetical protein